MTQKHEPDDKTRNQVRQLSGLGVVINDIAVIIGISDVTVRKYYSADITKGRAEADLQVSRALFKAATRGEPNVAACIFWLKNRRPDLWRDRVEQEHMGRGGVPLAIDFRWADANPGPAVIEARAEPEDEAEAVIVTFAEPAP